MHWWEEIEKLDGLRKSGAISEEDYLRTKDRVLARVGCGGERVGIWLGNLGREFEREEVWGALIHVSQFCGYVIPLAGFAAPVGLWLARRGESQVIDAHGRVVFNWLLSHLIWWAVGFVLSFVLVGVPILWVLAILTVVFPLVGAYRALKGEVWSYSLSLPFFSRHVSH
jgi:uncharacterized Tic20 family protein